MTEYLFSPAQAVSAAVDGIAKRFPIRRVFCVGRNYEAHAKEMGAAVDREAPFYFTKAALHVCPSGGTIPYPPGTRDFHHEMELVVALGRPGFRVARDRALELVYGYACGLDMTRRDLQLAARDRGRPWDIGKDFENAAVLSPIVPAERCGHPNRGRIELRVNGVVKQSSDIALLIHDVPALIADLSRFYHLQPGDLIFTGTPEGVGPVAPGDRLQGRIEGVGTIEATIGAPEE
ncbi:MAG: fumarylacetoacetate hydrolase family protein [Steroidobacteraceae bacterium]|nr:fumarylacetoacetate hydrolase family protein [Steroidobacteraceae bacterium]MDW8258319.1 fumarylacetoacetate hydrolase family protein [Gammaproteobacteria bacterium]